MQVPAHEDCSSCDGDRCQEEQFHQLEDAKNHKHRSKEIELGVSLRDRILLVSREPKSRYSSQDYQATQARWKDDDELDARSGKDRSGEY